MDVNESTLWMHCDEEIPVSDSFTMEINTFLSYVIISQRIQENSCDMY